MHFIYFFYYILRTDYKLLKKSVSCASKKSRKTKFTLIADMIYSSLKYGASFVDFFNFGFYMKSKIQRKEYATMGDMYMFHKKLNDKSKTHLLDNKELFAKHYASFCNTPVVLDKNSSDLYDFIKSCVGEKLVFKDPLGTAGKAVSIADVTIDNQGTLLIEGRQHIEFLNDFFGENNIVYVEKYLNQNKLINEISPSALNTIRVITIIDNKEEVHVIGSVFRISVDCDVDNYSRGNIAAEIDIKTGKVITGGIQKNSSCGEYFDFHPITHKPIKNFQIPMWDLIIETVTKAALILPQIRTVGWDVAVLEDSVILIEGNSQWNKDTWQIPAGYGKKQILLKYL